MTYWESKGKFQKEYEQLQPQIPVAGESDIPHIELLRCAVNIYYDVYNNGGCNLDVKMDEVEFIQKNLKRLDGKFSQLSTTVNALIFHGEDVKDGDAFYLPDTFDYDGLEYLLDCVIDYVAKQDQKHKVS